VNPTVKQKSKAEATKKNGETGQQHQKVLNKSAHSNQISPKLHSLSLLEVSLLN